MHLVPPYSSMFACAFSFPNSGSLTRLIRLTDDGNRQEDEDLSYEDVPQGDNDEGKS
jgi:hypothetical protein